MAPLTACGSEGGSRSSGRPRHPRSDRAAARPHASNSRSASTTSEARSGRAARTRSSSSGPRSHARSSSASITTSIPPVCPSSAATARLALRSRSPARSISDFDARMGCMTSTAASGRNSATTRWISGRIAARSPWPSTSGTIRAMGRSLLSAYGIAATADPSATAHQPCRADPEEHRSPRRPAGR